MKSKAQIAGHPLHPMLILIPAGAFVSALVMDVVYLLGGGELWFDATIPIIIIGLVGFGIAAIPGAIDLFTSVPREAFNIGLAHMAVNMFVFAAFLINLAVFRIDETAASAIVPGTIMSVVGVALLAVSGLLGSHMVYRYRVAVSEEPLPNKRKKRTIGNRPAASEGGEVSA